MQILDLKGTEHTPQVLFNQADGIFEISGRSLPDNARDFYGPVLKWLTEYSKEPNAVTALSFKLEYMNTGTSKQILDVLSLLEKIPNAKVLWHFVDEDEDMEETGEEFSELVNVPFEFKPY